MRDVGCTVTPEEDLEAGGAALLAACGDVPAADMSSEVLLLPVLLRAVLLVDYNQQKQRIISDNRNEEHGVMTRPRITAKIYSTR